MFRQWKKTTTVIASALLLSFGFSQSTLAAGDSTPKPPAQSWSWTGYFGTFDQAQLQRGLQVYLEVCSTCHGLQRLSYRHLSNLGYSNEEIKAIAANWEVLDEPNDEGDVLLRPARPSDRIVNPYPNDEAARYANGGALPPDLSLMIKGRATGRGSILSNAWDMVRGQGAASGADYVYGVLTGYTNAPEDITVSEGKYFNTYYSGQVISMSPPISDGLVDYADGTQATTKQMAADVTAFLAWASEPELEQRKSLGIKVMLYLVFFVFVLFLLKRRLWKRVH